MANSVAPSGIVAPEGAKTESQRGEALGVGDDGEMMKVPTGDLVQVAECTGIELRLDHEDDLVLDAADRLAVIRMRRSPEPRAAVAPLRPQATPGWGCADRADRMAARPDPTSRSSR